MKTILTLFILVASVTIMAQTNVISLKSHAGDLVELDQETDNFGEPPWKMNVDTVEFIEKGVIVEYRFLNRRDTLRSEMYDGYLTDRIEDYYSPRCVFIGFKVSKNDNFRVTRNSKENGVSWIIGFTVILLLLKYKKFKSLFSTVGTAIFIGFLFLFSTSLSAQTNIISLKSHAGEMAQLNEETDNFGAIYQPPSRNQVDTVRFIRNGVIVEYRQSLHQSQYTITNNKNAVEQEIDTIRNPYYTKILTQEIKNLYPSTTVFIGFKKQHSDAAKPYFDSIHKNGISIWAIILIGLMSFSFTVVKRFS